MNSISRFSFQTDDNASAALKFTQQTGYEVIQSESFKGECNNHKFKPGQNVRLVRLKDYPQFNGEVVEVSSIREDGHNGKAYYIKSDNEELMSQLNWVYEHRLETIYGKGD